MEIGEYARFAEDDAVKCANSLLGDTGDLNDTEIDIGTPINTLKFHLKDISHAIETQIAANDGLTAHLDVLETLSERTQSKIAPGFTQLKRSYDRLDQNVIKPYNECMDINKTVKRIHSTNKLLRGASVSLDLVLKIQQERKLYEKCTFINEFIAHMERSPFLKPLKSLELEESRVMAIRSDMLKKIQGELKDLSVYKTITTSNNGVRLQLVNGALISNDQELESAFKALEVLDNDLLLSISNNIFKSTITQCIQLIVRNINNAKTIPGIIMNFESVVSDLSRIETALKKTQAWSQLAFQGVSNKFWVELSINVEPRIKEVVSKGGPVARNFKMASNEIGDAIKSVVPQEENVELITMNAFKIQS